MLLLFVVQFCFELMLLLYYNLYHQTANNELVLHNPILVGIDPLIFQHSHLMTHFLFTYRQRMKSSPRNSVSLQSVQMIVRSEISSPVSELEAPTECDNFNILACIPINRQ